MLEVVNPANAPEALTTSGFSTLPGPFTTAEAAFSAAGVLGRPRGARNSARRHRAATAEDLTQIESVNSTG